MVEHKRLSPSGLSDLWEHACLLYHNFEWQSAADTFSQLSKLSQDPIDQKTFALNRGLIEARLGDFDLAAVSFEKALLLDADDPVAHFLLGVVSVELENHYTGYARLKSTLERLPAEVLDCRARGLDFGLARSAVEADIERVRATLKTGKDQAGKAKVTPIFLHNIPAELIFEAPPRPGSISHEERASVDRHESSTDSRSDARLTRDPKTPAPITPDSRSYSAINTAPTAAAKPTEIDFDPQLPNTSPLRSLPRKKLSPRDAQIREGSTKELARFLRHAGPSGAANITVDRLYLQRLMQGYNGFPTASQVYNQTHDSSDAVALATSFTNPHEDIESLLDLHIGSRPERGISPVDGAHSTVPKSVSRKPLPGAAVGQSFATG
jgi:tetratricopeptide (TPR) repeat protein